MRTSEVEARLMSLVTSQRAGYQSLRSANAPADDSGGPLYTKGEIEAAICEFINRFEQDFMGRGPKSIRAHLIGELLVVRLQGVLTAAEQQLVKSNPADKGRDLLKQVRTHLIETARPIMESMVHLVAGVKLLSLHHDISTVTGEEILLFTLAEAPDFRQPKKRQSQVSDWDS
jgi:uncharacterized protein YbcI